MISAPFVALAAAGVAMIACVLSVFAWWKNSRLVSQVRSIHSLRGELNEIRDYLAKIDAWAKRINARDVMNARRESTEHFIAPSEPEPDLKTALRRRVGLVPGKPAPHQ